MQFFTKIESVQTLADLPTAGHGVGHDPVEIQVNIENCPCYSAASSKMFVDLVGAKQTVFLWIKEFGVWPYMENRPLFDALRKASNEPRPLQEAPGHMFAADEQEALVSYLQLVIISGWSAVLLGLENRHRLIVSHDSWASIRSLADMPGLIRTVSDFGLPYLTKERPRDTLAALGLSRDGTLLNPQWP